MKDDLKYWIWLSSIPGVGVAKFNKLVNKFGSPKEVWNEVRHKNPKISDINPKILQNMQDKIYIEKLDEYFEKIKNYDINVITVKSDMYPKNLKNIYDPPPILYLRGKIGTGDENSIAIVGSRRATPYGLKVTEHLAKELAALGVTIISGMARGIDSCAHKGAIAGAGRTIAVLGCGVDIVYPRENVQLMNNIISQGAVISEYPPGAEPQKLNFPARNRIISGLAKGVIVVEAGEKSGTLITVDFALEQGREVFVVPGNINSSESQGTNRLIKEGAKPVTCIDDILEEIDLGIRGGRDGSYRSFGPAPNFLNTIQDTWESIEKAEGPFKDIDLNERNILKCVVYGQKHIDDIALESGIDIGTTSFLLTMLEVKGFIKQHPGMIYSLDN